MQFSEIMDRHREHKMTYWVKVQFKGSVREYTYLCNLPGVEEGDTLIVNGGYSGRSEVICTHVGGGSIPKIASKWIIEKIDDVNDWTNTSKGDRKMKKSFSDRMMNRFFRKVDGVKWDLMSGRVGVVLDDEGIVTLDGEGEDARIAINVMDEFGMAIPAFAQNTALDSVTVGDLIYQSNKVKGWVTEVVTKDGVATKFNIMTPSGTATNWTPPKVSMFGLDSGVMVLRSLINMLPKGEGGLGSMQNVLLPMMMMGGNDSSIEKMMPLMLLSQLGTDGTGNEAFGGGNMMQTMLMMQMFKGDNASGSGFFD